MFRRLHSPVLALLTCSLLVLLLASVSAAKPENAPLVLAEDGQTSYRIVVPDEHADDAIAKSIARAADLLQQAFAENGAKLEVVKESEAAPGSPSIYLGNTGFARENGVQFDTDSGWTFTFKAVGDNLIIVGNDSPDPMPLELRREREARQGGLPFLGTLKGVTEFLYKFAGVRFLFPGDTGMEFLETPRIAVPSDLDETMRTYGKRTEVARSSDIYEIANGLEPMPLVLSHYGHFHGLAVSPEVYGETNPEYFAFRSNKRDPDSNHLCFSNPEVRELIYNKVLEYCDTGYNIVEMGQNDGFIPCSCEECHELYGIHPTTTPEQGIAYLQDPAWGEKLWIMHRDMALRLQKDRPDKKLMISAYSIARNPPAPIERLPENVIVQMMHIDPEIFDDWSRIEVPGGFAAYTYTWGGPKPRNAVRHIEELVDTMVEQDIQMVQNNLKPRAHGLQGGATAYVFFRLMNDPEGKSANELYDEYIESAYGEAAGTMGQFYRRLNQRLDKVKDAEELARFMRDPMLAYNMLYTPDLMNALDGLLTRAEGEALSPKVKKRLEATRFEFDELMHVSQIIQFYYAYLSQPDEDSINRVLDAVDARNAWIKAHTEGELSDSFKLVSRGLQAGGGRGSVNDSEPFNWDTDAIRAIDEPWKPAPVPAASVVQASGPVSIDSEQWADVPEYQLQGNADEGELNESTVFQLLYDDQNLYVRVRGGMRVGLMDSFASRGRDVELWLQESINILLAPEGDRSQYYYLTYEPVDESFIDANHGYITDPLHPAYGWNDQTWDGDWKYVNDLQAEENQWISMATIPFSTLNVPAPSSGTIWAANVGRIHYFTEVAGAGHRERVAARELSTWTGKLPGSKNPGEADMGDLIFQ